MNLTDLVERARTSYGGSARIGSTSTVNEQVDFIEKNIQVFKRTVESHRQLQSELEYSIKKFQSNSKICFEDLHREISDKVSYLTQLFRSDAASQEKEFEYLQIQNSKLHQEHAILVESAGLGSERAESIENSVGI